jgi:uncharacterized membrane protein YGL010W
MPKDARNRLLENYEAEHRHPINRVMHAVGIPVVVLSTAALISPWRPFGWSWKVPLVALITGWGLLLVGHAIEGNRPAILRTPTAALSALIWWTRALRRRR